MFWRKTETICKSKLTTVWKFANFSPTIFLQKFRQIKYFTKELYCKSIWRKIFAVGENFWNFHTLRREFLVFRHYDAVSVFLLFDNFFSVKTLTKTFLYGFYDFSALNVIVNLIIFLLQLLQDKTITEISGLWNNVPDSFIYCSFLRNPHLYHKQSFGCNE